MKSTEFSDRSIGILCDWMASNGLMKPPKHKHHTREERAEVRHALDASTDQLVEAYQFILHTVRTQPHGEVKVKNFLLDPLMVQKLKKNKTYRQLMKEHLCLQNVFHIPPESMSEMFQIGMEQLHSKNYEMAGNIFLFLLYLNTFVAWFWQGLARSWEGLQRYSEALYAYGVAINCQPLDVELYRCATRLCLQRQEQACAKNLLEYGLEQFSTHTQHEIGSQDRRDLEAMLAAVNRAA